jgi:epoxyqueuosine reductase
MVWVFELICEKRLKQGCISSVFKWDGLELGMEKMNSQRLRNFFDMELGEIGYDGVVRVAEFRQVYCDLMPIQRSKLEDFCHGQLKILMKKGSIVCIGIAYPEHVIDCIDVRLDDGTIDKKAWNIYAREYHKLNRLLNEISKGIADRFEGIPIPATVEGIAVRNVEDYYRMTISHRVIAENAGLGWRGKNELIVNEKFSCALRFASVITNLPLIHGEKVGVSCGECKACLDACPFLKNKDRLDNYRESCRRYIIQLGLEGAVCGKCIKACYRKSIFSSRFKLR